MQCNMILSVLTFSFQFLPHINHHPVPLPFCCCCFLCYISPPESVGAAHLYVTVGPLPRAERVHRHHTWTERTLFHSSRQLSGAPQVEVGSLRASPCLSRIPFLGLLQIAQTIHLPWLCECKGLASRRHYFPTVLLAIWLLKKMSAPSSMIFLEPPGEDFWTVSFV